MSLTLPVLASRLGDSKMNKAWSKIDLCCHGLLSWGGGRRLGAGSVGWVPILPLQGTCSSMVGLALLAKCFADFFAYLEPHTGRSGFFSP